MADGALSLTPTINAPTFLALLSEVHRRYRAAIHASCLMANHYHLLIRTPEANLQRIMRRVNGLYTQYFNRTEGKDGALFRGRYQAMLATLGPKARFAGADAIRLP